MAMWLATFVWLFFVTTSVKGEKFREHLQKSRTEVLKRYPQNVYLYGDLKANLSFQPFSISRLDATAQTLSLTVNLQLIWIDSYLALNTTGLEYNQTILMTYSSKEIWTPIIAIMNSAFGDVFVFIDEHIPLMAKLDGLILTNHIVGLETKCNVDITRFPFDEQFCKVSVEEYIGVLNLTVDDSYLEIYDKGHTEWQVISVNITEDGLNPYRHTITFHLRRQSSFYVIGIVFPMILLSFLNSVVFLLPADSGEKISFLVSIFVTYAVFLNFVNDLIPKSDRMPRLALYLVLVQCHSTLCILGTLFILNRHHKHDDRIYQWHNQQEPKMTDGQDASGSPNSTAVRFPDVQKKCFKRIPFKTAERIMFLAFFITAALLTLVLYI